MGCNLRKQADFKARKAAVSLTYNTFINNQTE